MPYDQYAVSTVPAPERACGCSVMLTATLYLSSEFRMPLSNVNCVNDCHQITDEELTSGTDSQSQTHSAHASRDRSELSWHLFPLSRMRTFSARRREASQHIPMIPGSPT